MFLERWTFNFILVYLSVAYWIYLLMCHEMWEIGYLLILFYLIYAICDVFRCMMLLFYSNNKLSDIKLAIASPLMPFYYAYQKVVTLIAIAEELFLRKSFDSNFVPERVRKATWHW